MIGGSVEKFTVRFGLRLAGTDVVGSWAGKPSEFLVGGAGLVSNAAAPTQNELNNTGQAITIAASKTSPITAIGLAPDSPIAELDLYIGGDATPHRVSIGSPYLGTITETVSVVAVPVQSIPAIHRVDPDNYLTPAQFAAYVVPWEMQTTEQFNLGTAGTAIAPHPIAKLNVYRGTVALSAMIKRAGYHGEMMWRIYENGLGLSYGAALVMITDGRRRVRVHANRLEVLEGGAAASLTVYGVNAYKTADGATAQLSDGRIDLPTFDELLAATALIDDVDEPTILDYHGNPYFAFVALITGTINAKGTVKISAWDD